MVGDQVFGKYDLIKELIVFDCFENTMVFILFGIQKNISLADYLQLVRSMRNVFNILVDF